MKVRWTQQAFDRLADIEAYISQDNPIASARIIDKIIKRGDGLAQFPERGHSVPEIGYTDIREVFEGNYRVVYRVREQYVQILTVFERHLPLPKFEIERSE